MRKNRASVVFSNVTKSYFFRHEKPTLSDFVYFHNRKNESFTALSSVSFEVKQGERLAFIGVNGSGKTTVLKLMAGVTSPTSGNIHLSGRAVSLIDLAAGFHPDLSGVDNIIINALLIGMKKTEVKKQLDNIISFADIGQFIDQPFFTYSEGMKLRLGFSVGVHSNPDIFIIDENIAAGDENFKKKATTKIHELFNSGKTIILASHMLDFIKDNFNRVIWLEKGKIRMNGGVEVVDSFIASFK
ncbi:MAG TPA: ATP-binding cassette domain-containing protein [Candidatus Woesebacteria bacterium]|jgi:ABC-type polysaccharide/polyol phosphate transport system ATPase subunit|nr:ATP-binding cassette domain-containing protein [Candidatus Woesebacteria bacterium]HNS65304.1 ATP-binding cassette domain-containing protein [Candidatus Woesebacteria bacterium]